MEALESTVALFLVALHWGPKGIAAAWSISYWTLLIPGFWYAGRPIGFWCLGSLIAAIWRYVASALAAGLATAAIIRGTPLLVYPLDHERCFLGHNRHFDGSYYTLFRPRRFYCMEVWRRSRQFVSLLRELGPSKERQVAAVAEAV